MKRMEIASMPESDVLELLKDLLSEYEPIFRTDSRDGYECSWCRVLVAGRRKFDLPTAHEPNCMYIRAKQAVLRAEV